MNEPLVNVQHILYPGSSLFNVLVKDEKLVSDPPGSNLPVSSRKLTSFSSPKADSSSDAAKNKIQNELSSFQQALNYIKIASLAKVHLVTCKTKKSHTVEYK